MTEFVLASLAFNLVLLNSLDMKLSMVPLKQGLARALQGLARALLLCSVFGYRGHDDLAVANLLSLL
jgi:hypothetical protein